MIFVVRCLLLVVLSWLVDCAPFGTILGITDCEVAVFSSDYESIKKDVYPDDESFVSFFGEEFTGYKFQCVELARRYWLINFGIVFESIPMAFDIFQLKSARVVATNASAPLQRFPNGGASLPAKGSLLVWAAEGDMFKVTGHVAVVVDAGPHHIDIAEQNVLDEPWTANYSRRLPATLDPTTGAYTVSCTFEGSSILGWVSIPGAVRACQHRRSAQAPGQESRARPWLDETDPAVRAWVQHHHGEMRAAADADADSAGQCTGDSCPLKDASAPGTPPSP
jgi:glutathionylspermidine amidase/synthetase